MFELNPDQERHATWLELFFDLVFVAAITMVGSVLATQAALPGILVYMALFVPIWWAWVGYTVYSSRFVRDDMLHRGLTAVLMLAAAGMAVQVSHVAQSGGLAFAVSYIVARVALLLLYAREHKVAFARYLRRLYMVGFGLGAAVWVVSLLVPPPARYGLWLLGMGIDLATPWLGRRGLQQTPLNVAHLPERMGLFTLILLGEGIVVVVDGLSHITWALVPVLIATLAFSIALSIWSMYFAFVSVTRFECRLGSGQPYLYSHLVLALGLTALAAGIKRAIKEAAYPALSEPTVLLLGLGAVIWFLSFLVVKLVSYDRPRPADMGVFGLAAAATVVLTTVCSGLPPLAVFGGLTAVFAGVALAEWRMHRHDQGGDRFIAIDGA